MAMNRKLVGLFALTLAAVIGCGGTITGSGPDGGSGGTTGMGGSTGMAGTTGTGGATTTIPCSAMNACSCLAAADRCAPRSEACWCPSECYPDAPILCVCGGGRFLGCEDQNVVAACTAALSAVQTKCAGQSFVGYIGAVCTSIGNPTCIAGCLQNLHDTGSCAEIDCSFCPVCDCAAPATPSPFAACLQTCLPTR
jgi:hypothetical protein